MQIGITAIPDWVEPGKWGVGVTPICPGRHSGPRGAPPLCWYHQHVTLFTTVHTLQRREPSTVVSFHLVRELAVLAPTAAKGLPAGLGFTYIAWNCPFCPPPLSLAIK